MDQFNIDHFNEFFNKNFGWLRTNDIVLTVLVLFLVSYVTVARPQIPFYVEKLLSNSLFRFLIISYILYKSTNNIQVSILLTVGFLYIMQLVSRQKIERMNNLIENYADETLLINDTVNSPYCNLNESNKVNPQCQIKLKSNLDDII